MLAEGLMNTGRNNFLHTGAAGNTFLKSGNRRARKNKARKFGFVHLVAVQCILCAFVASAVFIDSKVGKNDSTEKQGAFGGVASSQAAEPSAKNKAVYSASDFEVVTAKITVDSAKTASATLDDAVAVGKIIGGGEDIGSEQAIKGTSFASYTVSAPVNVPVDGRLTSPFGYRTNPVSGKYGFHTGIDLAAPEGTPVAAAYGGRVVDSGESDVWGKYVLVEHSDGFETYYCHLSEIYAPEETVLRKGETLGLVGSTGWSTGPHLHFEVRIDGVRVDPEPLIYPDEN